MTGGGKWATYWHAIQSAKCYGDAKQSMTLEQYITRLHSLAFWKEFTFGRNRFAPQPGNELELADNLIWLGNYACVLQLKEREDETDDPDIERSWFMNKVLKKATS